MNGYLGIVVVSCVAISILKNRLFPKEIDEDRAFDSSDDDDGMK